MRDERPDLLLLKEVEQGDQVLSKPCRFPPFERLDAVGDHPFPAREKPAAGDVQRVDRDSMQAITTTRAACSQPLPTERRSVSIAHDPPAGAESLAGMPEVATPDRVEDDVDALAREAVNLLREVLVLIIDRDGAQVGNCPRPARRTGAVQLQPGEA